MFRFKVDDDASVIITDREQMHGPGEEFTMADSLATKSNGVASLVGSGKIRVLDHKVEDNKSPEPLVIEDRFVTEDFVPHRHVAVQSEHELKKEKHQKETAAVSRPEEALASTSTIATEERLKAKRKR